MKKIFSQEQEVLTEEQIENIIEDALARTKRGNVTAFEPRLLPVEIKNERNPFFFWGIETI